MKSPNTLGLEAQNELFNNILLFWVDQAPDPLNGGFRGLIQNDLTVDPNAEKSCILHLRILWTFSAAYRHREKEIYRQMAGRAFQYLKTCFWDPEHSGLYFMTGPGGEVTDPRKYLYNLAFGIYGFSEYFRATGERESLDLAVELYRLVENYTRDPVYKGYFEAFARDWRPLDDMRLGAKDLNAPKSMNAHLHLLEAYTNLLQVWPNQKLQQDLVELIRIMIDKIIDPETGHFNLFFDEKWHPITDTVSYGHDIEGSWLLCKAAEAAGEPTLLAEVKKVAAAMAERVYLEGIDREYGGLFNEKTGGVIVTDKEWWPQCEAVVGFLNAFQLTGEEYFFAAAEELWQYCRRFFVDPIHGEWFFRLSRAGIPDQSCYKAGPWKGPYHNGRACLEVIARLLQGK